MRNTESNIASQSHHLNGNPPESQNGYQKKVSEIDGFNTIYLENQDTQEDHSPNWGVHSTLKRAKPNADDLFEYEE